MEKQLAFAFDALPPPPRRTAVVMSVAQPIVPAVSGPTPTAPSDAPRAVAPSDTSHRPVSPRAPALCPDPRHPRRLRRAFGRYARRRRLPPQPKPFCGYGAYRLIVAGMVAYVVGPMGKVCDELTQWARHVMAPPPPQPEIPGARRKAASHDPLAETRRLIAAMDSIRELLDAVNWVHPTYPDVVADLLDPKPAKAREVMKFWLTLRGCTFQKGRGHRGGKIVLPRVAADQWTVGVTITRWRQLFDFWRDAGIRPGHNPMQMDADRSRMALGETRKVKRGKKRWWLDVDGLFRTRQVERQAPRPGDAGVALKVLARGREMGWPDYVQLKFQGMYLTGSRLGQMDALTAYGLLVAAKDERHIALIKKGSKGELAWQALAPPAWREALIRLAARHAKVSVATLVRWARSGSDIDHARLRRIYVLSPDGVAPVPQWKSAHLLRQAVESLGLRYEVARDDGTRVVKWFTSHWFRHVFCNRMLDRIAASSADQATRDRARAKFAEYMGWADHSAMLAYYGRHHDQQEADLLVMNHQDDLNEEALGSFVDEEWLAANDNGIVPAGMAAGGDLLD